MFVIKGHEFNQTKKISGSAKDRSGADRVFDQMVAVVLLQLAVPKESFAVVSMFSTLAREGKYIRKVKVSYGKGGQPVAEGFK